MKCLVEHQNDPNSHPTRRHLFTNVFPCVRWLWRSHDHVLHVSDVKIGNMKLMTSGELTICAVAQGKGEEEPAAETAAPAAAETPAAE